MQTMDRKEFLSLVGLGSAALALTYCFGGCQPQNSGVPNAPTNVNFTLDLANAAYSALESNGGYIYSNGVIVARTVSGDYVAVSKYCTHAGGTVVYDSRVNNFYCPVHGSVFSTNGSVVNGPASIPLVKYNTSLTGTSLRVYS
jgi:cytochrome b6-f complex iron-sulfur subunit